MDLGQDIKLQDQLQDTASSLKADYIEIRAEELFSTTVIFKGKNPEVIASPDSKGFFIRVLKNGSWGEVSFTDIDQLKEKLSQALEFAKASGKGRVSLAPAPVVIDSISPLPESDFRQIPLKQKVNLVKRYNKLLLTSAKGVQTSNISYGDQYLTKFFVNSEGSRILQTRSYVRVSFSAVARNKEAIEVSRGSAGSQLRFKAVEGLEPKMIQIAKEAVELSKSPKLKSGKYTVILDPYMAGTFAHEAFGHFSEADHQYENPALLKQMQLGKKLGSNVVNIIDDPTINDGWGDFVYDDEGVKAVPVELLKGGVIKGRLHSRETAAKLKEKLNGRARADGFASMPIIRMSNTLFVGGKSTLKELITSTKDGLLIVNWLAGMTALESFTFTPMYGVVIKNGRLKNKVRGLKLMGNVFNTLKNIEAVSSDLQLDQGTCGKLGQSMPVGSGGGYVKINNVMVGGE